MNGLFATCLLLLQLLSISSDQYSDSHPSGKSNAIHPVPSTECLVSNDSLGVKGNAPFDKVLLSDDFSEFPMGKIAPQIGAHTEYHYLKEAKPLGSWKITSFYHNPRGSDTVWRIEAINGKKAMVQSIVNNQNFTHPMIMAGNSHWKDYSAGVTMTPSNIESRAGLIFRYHNDRQYYFFGQEKGKMVLLTVDHETGFHMPKENVLAAKKHTLKSGETFKLSVVVRNQVIEAYLNDQLQFEIKDATWQEGQIALMADAPTSFHSVLVKSSESEIERVKEVEKLAAEEEMRVQMTNPIPVVWKKIRTNGFGVGRNLRFGDLDNDGQTDILIGQVVHHAYPRDSFSELSCLTAISLDGKILWQTGTPSGDHQELTNDVAFQIYDIDSDGRNEVIYTMNCELIVADGATGKTKFKRSTPELEAQQYDAKDPKKVVKSWSHILGDCLFLCDLRGLGRAQDLVIKDRYTNFWVLDEQLNTQWRGACRTGHYPFSSDTDGDGREELFIGYSCYNWKGDVLWSLDEKLKDHCDGIGVVNFGESQYSAPRVFIAASDQGAVTVDTNGKIRKIDYIGHVQNPAIANFRSDLPGLETVTINFWGNQGILHLLDSNQAIYHDFEPTSFGSMCLPINWNGSEEELFVLNANVQEGGLFDGWGRRAVLFPNDGHPEMCNAVLNLTGDLRDEIVVWDPDAIWIYTQNDSPKSGNLHPTRRNPLYNYSNYQLTLSIPQ